MRRRGGRRAGSSAGAPVTLEPVDLTAPAETATAPRRARRGRDRTVTRSPRAAWLVGATVTTTCRPMGGI